VIQHRKDHAVTAAARYTERAGAHAVEDQVTAVNDALEPVSRSAMAQAGSGHASRAHLKP
jgi:hypothetical protein